jgi:hypothetical protein
VTEPSKNPYIITGPPESFTTKELHAWAKDTLPEVVKQPLFDINGKKTKSMRLGDFLDAESQKNLE